MRHYMNLALIVALGLATGNFLTRYVPKVN